MRWKLLELRTNLKLKLQNLEGGLGDLCAKGRCYGSTPNPHIHLRHFLDVVDRTKKLDGILYSLFELKLQHNTNLEGHMEVAVLYWCCKRSKYRVSAIHVRACCVKAYQSDASLHIFYLFLSPHRHEAPMFVINPSKKAEKPNGSQNWGETVVWLDRLVEVSKSVNSEQHGIILFKCGCN